MEDQEEFTVIVEENLEKLPESLKNYLKKQEVKYAFPELIPNGNRRKIWGALYNLISNAELSNLHADLLTLARVLSRDKACLDELVTEAWIQLLIERACLKDCKGLDTEQANTIAIEALKCLCNVIFNCNAVARMCSKNGLMEAIIERIKNYKDEASSFEIKYFDMKILFLITALCEHTRAVLKSELQGLTYLIETLELLLKQVSKEIADPKNLAKLNLSDIQVDFCCELLKVLFNITLNENFMNSAECDEEDYHSKLVTTLHHYLLLPVSTESKKFELHSNIVNLLTNMPGSCYKCLVTPFKEGKKVSNRFQYNGHNMVAVQELVYFLENRFVVKQPNVSNQSDHLLPILTVLLKCVTSDRNIRKYLRIKILPPLTDIYSRPEQGEALRNYLCRLLTTPITEVRDLAAELLFVLCKENVGRMIKYTGYGNAAGLFANRGLLGGKTRSPVENYSSDSEDSDTDEYKEMKHSINPVMGCYEAPHANPMANMTEEQKEYEAMKLVELMETLTRHGIVKPCKVGLDGRPEPIEHVLQLQEGLRNQLNINSDSE